MLQSSSLLTCFHCFQRATVRSRQRPPAAPHQNWSDEDSEDESICGDEEEYGRAVSDAASSGVEVSKVVE